MAREGPKTPRLGLPLETTGQYPLASSVKRGFQIIDEKLGPLVTRDEDSNSFGGAAGGGPVGAADVSYTPANDSNSVESTVQAALDDHAARLVDLELRPYDVGFYIEGDATDESKTRHFVATRDFYIPADFAGSQAFAENSDDTALVFTVLKNGAAIGTITLTGDSNSDFSAATFDAASPSNSDSDFAFAPGDRLSIGNPASFGTWSNIAITLLGYRN